MPTPDPGVEPIGRDDAEAVLAARAELGPGYDDALVDAFAERIERVVEARVSHVASTRKGRSRAEAMDGARQTALGIGSVVAGIPITAIAANSVPDADSFSAVVVAWLGIVGVNVAHAWQSRRRD